MLRTWLPLVVLVLAVVAVSGADVVMIRVVPPSREYIVEANRIPIPDSPIMADSLGVLWFSFELAGQCTIVVRGVEIEDRPGLVCKESNR